MPTPSVQVLKKAIHLLAAIEQDGGRSSLSTLASATGLPAATAHRIAATLTAGGYLVVIGRGRFMIGPRLISLASGRALDRVLTALGAPIVRDLARRTRTAAHLGVLEDDMVTYLVKSGSSGASVLSREGMQLEAYCSGIGKVLLAHLPESERRRYLSAGGFVRLTPNTITNVELLRKEFARVRRRSFAIDNGEIDNGLRCVAAPLRDTRGTVIAAMSISGWGTIDELLAMRPHLLQATARLEQKLFAN